jgi:hypothetical protein
MQRWEILPGLPPYGPPAISLSSTGHGKHSEGFVVRFFTPSGESWVGNFSRGLVKFQGVFEHPDGERAVVVAGGTAYVVSPERRACDSTFGAQIGWCCNVPTMHLLVFATLVDVLILDQGGNLSRSCRISWDGLSDLKLDGHVISGRAYTPLDEEWRDFQIDLESRDVIGGTYP